MSSRRYKPLGNTLLACGALRNFGIDQVSKPATCLFDSHQPLRLQLDLATTADEGPGTLQLDVSPLDGRLKLTAHAEQFDLASFCQAWSLPAGASGIIDGTLDGLIDPDNIGASAAEFALECTRVRLPFEIELEALIRGRMDQGVVHSNHSRFSLYDNHVDVSELELDLTTLLANADPQTPQNLLPNRAQVHLNCRELERVVPLWLDQEVPTVLVGNFQLLGDLQINSGTWEIPQLQITRHSERITLQDCQGEVGESWTDLASWTAAGAWSANIPQLENFLPQQPLAGSLQIEGHWQGSLARGSMRGELNGSQVNVPGVTPADYVASWQGTLQTTGTPDLQLDTLQVSRDGVNVSANSIHVPPLRAWDLTADEVLVEVEDLPAILKAGPTLDSRPEALAVKAIGRLGADEWSFPELTIGSPKTHVHADLRLTPSHDQRWFAAAAAAVQVSIADTSTLTWLHPTIAEAPGHFESDLRWTGSRENMRMELRTLSLATASNRFALVEPTTIEWRARDRIEWQPITVRDQHEQFHALLSGAALWQAPNSTLPDHWDLTADLRATDLQFLSQLAELPFSLQDAVGHLTLTGTIEQPQLQGALDALLLPTSARFAGREPLVLRSEFSAGSDAVEITTLRATSPELHIDGSGRWSLPWRQIVQQDDWNMTDWEGSGKFVAEARDLAEFQTLLPDLRRVGGQVQLELDVQGSLGNPQLIGNVHWSNGELRLNSVNAPTLTSLDMQCRLEKGALFVEQCTGLMGYAPFEVGGSATLANPPILDLWMRGDNVLLSRGRSFKVRASPDLTIRGPLHNAAVHGQLEFTDTRLSKKLDLLYFIRNQPEAPQQDDGLQLFSVRSEPFKDWELDVALRSTDGVHFSTNVLQTKARPNVQLLGTLEVPYLVGQIYLDQSTIKLPAATLRATQGTIRFFESSPFHPQIEAMAETTMLGYDVNVFLSDQLRSPSLLLTSSPPLSEEDLLLLISTGQPPADSLDRKTGERALSSVAVFLAKDLFRNTFGDESAESSESFLDRFELETGREISRSGTETIEARFRIYDEVLVERDSLYLEAERSTYDEINMGLRLVFRFP